MVPCALVSRGIISTRIAGSFHFGRMPSRGCEVSGSRGCEVTPTPRPRDRTTPQPRSQSRLLRRLLLEQRVVDVDCRVLAQALQERGAEIARLALPHHLAV